MSRARTPSIQLGNVMMDYSVWRPSSLEPNIRFSAVAGAAWRSPIAKLGFPFQNDYHLSNQAVKEIPWSCDAVFEELDVGEGPAAKTFPEERSEIGLPRPDLGSSPLLFEHSLQVSEKSIQGSC
jgi:hypothetical protein